MFGFSGGTAQPVGLVAMDRTSVAAAGALLVVGMASGVWKWLSMRASPEARAPLYVDILHRAALLYSAATLVLGALVGASAFPRAVNVGAFWSAYTFFVMTLCAYAFHGWIGTKATLFTQRTFVTGPGMVILASVELGATLVLLVGSMR